MDAWRVTLRVHGPVPDSPHSDAEATLGLLRELRGHPGLRVTRAGPDPRGDHADPDRDPTGAGVDPTDPSGHKGASGSLTELVVTGLFSATTIAGLARVAVAFIQRGAARKISLRDGDRSLTITGPSEDTERLAAEWLGHQPAPTDPDAGAG